MREYTRDELNKGYESLLDDQKKVLDEQIKRGRKTNWLNSWAEKKGIVLTDEELESPDETMNSLLDWILLDYEERMTVDPNMRCECGRALKRRYTVFHKQTGKIYRLGEVHFAQHTEMEPETVRLIRKGLAKIDLERDEILSKVIEGWQLPFKIPESLKVPPDILIQLNIKLPLLERQINKLQRMIVIGKHGSLAVVEKPKSKYFSRDEFTGLFDKLKKKKITSWEARELYEFVKNNYDSVQEYGFDIQRIKQTAAKALGYFGDKSIRQWLVELEYLK